MLKHCRAIAVAGFLTVVSGGAVWAQNPNSGAPGTPPATTNGEPTFTVNFKDTDIQEIIKFVADVTGKTIVVDPRVKGRVKVISNKQVDKHGLMELFRSVLEVHDFMVVEVGEVVRIIPLKDARNSPVPVTEVGDTKEEGFITQVIQLKNIDAAKVLPVLRPLVPQHSHLASYPDSNAIVVSDTYANIKRLREVIEKIDTAALPTTEVIDLKYADAEELVATITKLGRAEQKGAAPANQLQMVADSRNNAILLSGEDLQRERAKQLIRRLDRSQQQSGNVRVIYLDYAKAKDVAAVLTKVVQNMQKTAPGGEAGKSPEQGATVEADEDTNALLITGNVDMINSLMSIIERLDIRRAQVLVEAIIVTIDANAGEDLGVEWLFSNGEQGVFGSSVSSSGSRVGAVAQGLFQGTDGDDDNGDAQAAGLAGALVQNAGQLLGVAGTSSDEKFIALLRALKSSSEANILSTPSLLTMDNHEASISVGQQVPFQTGSFSSVQGGGGITSPFTTTQREDVGILLTVTPHVNESNKVLLDVSQEVSALTDDDVGGQPITNQSKIETQILADDGQILVLGGLIEENARQNMQKVPLLGNIPLIGNLFQFQSTTYRKSNLMVFLRAKIMRDDEDMYGATGEKYRYMRDEQLKRREKGLRLMDDELIPVMPPISSEQLKEIEKALREEELKLDGDKTNGEASE